MAATRFSGGCCRWAYTRPYGCTPLHVSAVRAGVRAAAAAAAAAAVQGTHPCLLLSPKTVGYYAQDRSPLGWLSGQYRRGAHVRRRSGAAACFALPSKPDARPASWCLRVPPFHLITIIPHFSPCAAPPPFDLLFVILDALCRGRTC